MALINVDLRKGMIENFLFSNSNVSCTFFLLTDFEIADSTLLMDIEEIHRLQLGESKRVLSRDKLLGNSSILIIVSIITLASKKIFNDFSFSKVFLRTFLLLQSPSS